MFPKGPQALIATNFTEREVPGRRHHARSAGEIQCDTQLCVAVSRLQVPATVRQAFPPHGALVSASDHG